MHDSTLIDWLLVGFLFTAIMFFTVWFGGWIHKNKDEALNFVDNHDEHKQFLDL